MRTGSTRPAGSSGERHFEGGLGVDFKVVTKASELP